jgi:hypothetical protein
MKITIHHLNRNGKKIGIKEVDLTKYSKFGSTGNSVYFQPRRGKGFDVSFEDSFKHYQKEQQCNNESAGISYHYARIDENKSDSVKNRKRDEKGKPIKIYEPIKDLYEEWNFGKWWFIDGENWDRLLQYIKDSGTPHLYYFDGQWIED